VPPAPTPIVPGAWSTVTNSTFHYTIQYPSNWYVVRGGPAGNQGTDFAIVNWDPAHYHPFPPDAPTPPYTIIGVQVDSIPAPQSPADYYSSQQNNSPSGPPPCSRTTQQVTIAGHAALEVVQWPTPDTGYGPINYPRVTYDVADGVAVSTTWMFQVWEAYSPNGQPSATLAQTVPQPDLASMGNDHQNTIRECRTPGNSGGIWPTTPALRACSSASKRAIGIRAARSNCSRSQDAARYATIRENAKSYQDGMRNVGSTDPVP
jgi:hypothetical protein